MFWTSWMDWMDYCIFGRKWPQYEPNSQWYISCMIILAKISFEFLKNNVFQCYLYASENSKQNDLSNRNYVVLNSRTLFTSISNKTPQTFKNKNWMLKSISIQFSELYNSKLGVWIALTRSNHSEVQYQLRDITVRSQRNRTIF